jgi:hypothetical protein
MWCFDHQWESCRRDEPSIVFGRAFGYIFPGRSMDGFTGKVDLKPMNHSLPKPQDTDSRNIGSEISISIED